MTTGPVTTGIAVAHPNIALVKYWGKADVALNLPATGSLSMTLDLFPTTTSVERADIEDDEFTLNGKPVTGVAHDRVTRFLDIVRALTGSTDKARVVSTNTVPSAAGLASSASGFAALAAAASAAYGVSTDTRDLSRLARRGSGSAARSILSGFSVWHAGSDQESFAEPLRAPDAAMIITTVDDREKAVSSREAMKRTALTSPFYAQWVSSTEEILDAALAACGDDDFTRLGRITETHALRMHALIQSCDPPIRYLRPRSIALFDRVEQLRTEGIEAYATADAGPNVVVLTRPADAEAAAAALAEIAPVQIARPGPGVQIVSGNDTAPGEDPAPGAA